MVEDSVKKLKSYQLYGFSMRYDTASATYTLQIKDVQRTDEAVYQCEIQVSTTNKVSKYVNLKVSQPPVILDNSTRSVVVQEGQEAELLCDAAGSPQPQVLITHLSIRVDQVYILAVFPPS